METYEVVNKVLMPLDEVLGVGIDALKKTGVYDPIRHTVMEQFRNFKRADFVRTNQLEVIGEENIPDDGCLVASNHASWLDVQVIGAGTRKKLYFVAKADFKEWPFLRRMIDFSDGIYVRRGGDDAGLDSVAEAVVAGKPVVLFPEGTIPGEEDVPRWDAEPDTGLLRGRTGMIRVALKTGKPIVPCGVSGTGRAFPPEAYPRFQKFPPVPEPFPITVKYGKPIHIPQPPNGEITKEFLREQAHRVMLAITALIDHTRDYVPITLPLKPKVDPVNVPRMAYSRSPKKLAKGTKAPLGVLVLHGFTSDVHCVDALVKPLDEADLPYRFPILRGHGTKYQDLVGVTNRDWYEDAENAMLDLYRECEQIVVVGLSMGGVCVLELAARHRDKVAGVVTVAAALKFVDPLAGMTPLIAKVVKFWPSPNSYNDAELKKKENRNYPKFATASFASLLEFARNTTNLLSFVKAPILIMQSKKDQIVAPSAANLIHSKVSSRDKEIAWFEKSGHEMLLDLEAPKAIDTVMGFIKKIRG